ncbi:RnfH family protein [Acinetobacter sp. ANC 4558]|uniref:RnfH family protein n=1 Tax=Acinetobacter sp. ANC 4558 TaxID=1977876 RepID=UPI000A33A1F8|nr:RnfH family protein [Acinetobacter sp. ANC 4558]OTG86956.1 RnfH family protein [Acinetobacter sp. ANC 4558]
MNMIPYVWVAYATPDQQLNLAVEYQEGLTAKEAIELSGIRMQVDLPEILQLGIFGVRLTDENQILAVGDRVEIYRALTVNPKDIRRKRAENHPVGRIIKGNRFKQLK